MSFVVRNRGELVWLTSTQFPEVPHGFTTRPGGVSAPPWDSLNLGPGRGDRPEAVRENYRRCFAALGLNPDRAVLAKQVHETSVRAVSAADAGKGLLRERDYTADALLTGEPDLPLVVFSADCGILLLHDPESGAVGAVHAGWRGCAEGIVEKAVREMGRLYGTNPARLHGAIGPCIGPCCFETDADVPEAMRKALGAEAEPFLLPPGRTAGHTSGGVPSADRESGGKWHVDLAGLNRLWLLRCGVPAENVDVCGLCTACRPDWFWSHRKMGERRGVQTAVIARRR